LFFTAAVCSLGIGCATVSDLKYELTQKVRTQKAWEHYDTGTVCCSSAYRKGWKAGYYDVLTGNCGTPPLFPPEHLSSPLNITWHCDDPRHDWYVGFQDGAACAQQQPDTHYLKPWLPPCDCPADECPLQEAPFTSSLMMEADSDFSQPSSLPETFLQPEQPAHTQPQIVPPANDEPTQPELAPPPPEDGSAPKQPTAPAPPSLDISPEAAEPIEPGPQSALFQDLSPQRSAMPERTRLRIQPVSETRPERPSSAVQSPMVTPAFTPDILNQQPRDIVDRVTTA